MARIGTFVLATVVAVTTLACSQSDAGITTSVKSRLAAEETVSALDINVTTHRGVVTLSGDVETPAEREMAVRIARETEGVRNVVDELRIETAATGGRDDDDDVDVDVNVGDDIERGAREAGDAIQEGAERTGEAIRGAGERARDAVTDRDRDSDNDGK